MSSNYIGQTFMNQLEYIQRRAIRAIMDVPFCSLNEIIVMELSFFKIKHYLWMKTLTFWGRLLSYGYQEVEGRLFII